MSLSLLLLGLSYWGCSNSGLDRTTATGDTGADGGNKEKCPFIGEWEIKTVQCFSFDYDDWFQDFETAKLEIEDGEDGGCKVQVTLEGPSCEQQEEWTLGAPAGAEVEVTYEGITDCTPNQCEFDDDIPSCANGEHTGDGTLTLELIEDELVAGGLLQYTTPNCDALSTTWEKN